ncbi:IS3 family transposase, partial [Bacillus mycoides]|uniref:IS3 family transposase n=1 Tax=Bacillus mycoides TaxID=1405 RepID=UPI003CC7C65C
MSPPANSSHNPPQQSFFPHFKHQPHIKTSTTFTHLKQQIKHYIKYYNHHPYHSNLKN